MTAAGSKLLVPVTNGVLVINADEPELLPTLMPLDNPGNILAGEPVAGG